MEKRRPSLSAWLFPVWTLVIFLHSLQPADLSGQESGWVLSLLIQLVPWLTDYIIRKTAHFTEFAVLGFLSIFRGRVPLWGSQRDEAARSGRQPEHTPPAVPLSRRMAVWFSLSLCAAAALCDETIQLFVEGRSGQVSDVWLDIGGAAFGILLAAAFRVPRRRKGGKTA